MVLAVAAVLACNGKLNPDAVGGENRDGLEGGVGRIEACFAESSTRTVLAADGTSVLWSPCEEINVFCNGAGAKYVSENTLPAATASFTGRDSLVRAAGEYIYGAYPYSADNSIDSGGRILMTVPDVQTAVEGSFGPDAFPSVARSATNTLAFRNVCGGLCFTLGQDGIRSVLFRGNSGETVSGTVKISFSSDGIPQVAEVCSGRKSVILEAPDSNGFQAGKKYYVSLLPVSLGNGFSVEFIKRSERGTGTVSTPVTVKRSVFGLVANLDGGVVYEKSEEAETELFNAANRVRLNNFLEDYLSVEGKESAADGFVSSQQPDGSWSDVNYADPAKSGWDAMKHINRIVTMSCAYHCSGKAAYFNSIARALDYWTTASPTCVNWWYNEINVPKTLGPAMLLIRQSLTPEMLEDADAIMDKATISRTGQNLVWLSGNVLMNAVLKRDEALARQAHAAMTGEITVVPKSSTLEGIQYDWSFHQHGAQLQFGNYGLSFVTEFANWFKAWKGTCLEVTGEKLDIMQNYVYNGLEWVFWNGCFDHSACGRQVTPNAQKSKYRSASNAILKMGLELRSPVGARYYPKSDFGVYRARDWYASVRMQSSGTVGYETTNNENKKGYFSADGATLVRRNGDEYYNVSPVWNWRHIPGVTCYDDGGTLSTKFVKNNTTLVFGTTSGEYMALGMKIKRNNLEGKKAWFFCPEGYVCLGAGITMSKGYDVTTAVEQCLLSGTVEQGLAGGAVDSTSAWIRHNGITYVPFGTTGFKVDPATHSGRWVDIYPSGSSTEVTADLLDIYIDHGVNPSGAQYSYMVVPTAVSGETAASYIGSQVRVLSNTTSIQQVVIFGKLMTVKWGDDAYAEITDAK